MHEERSSCLFTLSNSACMHADGCNESSTGGGYMWEETGLGDYASSDCPCSEFSRHLLVELSGFVEGTGTME